MSKILLIFLSIFIFDLCLFSQNSVLTISENLNYERASFIGSYQNSAILGWSSQEFEGVTNYNIFLEKRSLLTNNIEWRKKITTNDYVEILETVHIDPKSNILLGYRKVRSAWLMKLNEKQMIEWDLLLQEPGEFLVTIDIFSENDSTYLAVSSSIFNENLQSRIYKISSSGEVLENILIDDIKILDGIQLDGGEYLLVGQSASNGRI